MLVSLRYFVFISMLTVSSMAGSNFSINLEKKGTKGRKTIPKLTLKIVWAFAIWRATSLLNLSEKNRISN